MPESDDAAILLALLGWTSMSAAMRSIASEGSTKFHTLMKFLKISALSRMLNCIDNCTIDRLRIPQQHVGIAAMSLASEPESGSFVAAARQSNVDQALEQAEHLLGIAPTPTMLSRQVMLIDQSTQVFFAPCARAESWLQSDCF